MILIYCILLFMSTLATQIDYYFKIAMDVNKKIGGTRYLEAQKNAKDKFTLLKDNVTRDLHYVKKKIEQRQTKKRAQLLEINLDIKQRMEEIFNQLERMKECLNSDTSNETSKDIKYQIVERFKDQAKNLQDLIEGVSDSSRQLNSKVNTLTDSKAFLLDHEGKNKSTYRVKNKRNAPTQIQLQAMERWKKEDEMIDEKIDDITQKTIEWKNRVKETGVLLDESDNKITKLTEQVDKVNDDLLRSNKQLKGIVEEYRKPHKFCIDVVLVLILIGLVVAIIKMTT